MNKVTHVLMGVALLLAIAQPASAQKRKFTQVIDSLLTARYKRSNIDTNYVVRPQTKWTVTARVNMYGSRIKSEGITKGLTEGMPFEMQLDAKNKATVSASVSYMGLSLSMSLNPAKLIGKYKDLEIDLRSYGPRFGFDISYQDANNFEGWYKERGVRQDLKTTDDMFRLRTLYANAYYAFNYRRFSYPAAFVPNYIQRRSAGSFLLALSGHIQYGEIDNGTEKMDFKMNNLSLGVGYGYNFVPGRGWMLHASLLPTYVVLSKTSLNINDKDAPFDHHFPEGIITARVGVIKQIGSNKFAGLSSVYNHTFVGDKDNLSVSNQKWNTSFYFGFRF